MHPIKDRKSTRLNSSHLGIWYAAFCLKKKKRTVPPQHQDYSRRPQSRNPRQPDGSVSAQREELWKRVRIEDIEQAILNCRHSSDYTIARLIAGLDCFIGGGCRGRELGRLSVIAWAQSCASLLLFGRVGVGMSFVCPVPCPFAFCLFFFFNDTATTEIYTLSLHDALPI